jgi:DNA helicase-2/ATP-dependent DNA helicase PcrA
VKKDFDFIYEGLNTNQKKAVNTIEGCVMVVAGPGTGKTQVLGARVAQILRNTDSSAQNILCLTFTDAATTALRNRLYEFVGSESYKVNISTYHGFCNMVIQEHKDYFGIQDLKPVSELEEIEVLREIVDEMPNEHPLKRFKGDSYYEVDRLKKLFKLMKKEGWTSTSINKMVSDKLEELKTDPTLFYKRKTGNFVKGDFKINDYKKEEIKYTALQAAANLFNSYVSKLADRRRYDFDDMLLWVLEAFERNPDILLQYQEKFHYFLVDEYQDTNGVQNSLLYALINYWENPNVFVVGDDDQSIYKFQGANVQNIFEFYKKYEDFATLIVLDENYRSSQSILNGSNAVISRNKERLVGKVQGLHKNITAANCEVKDIANAIKIVEYPNSYQETVAITAKLKALIEKGVSLSNVGILYRNHSQSEELIRYLESEGISYNVAKTQDVLQEPIIHQLNTFLEYLSLETNKLESGEHLLFEILHFNSFKSLTAFDIAQLSSFLYHDRRNDRKEGLPKGWRTQLNDIASTLQFSQEAKTELKSFVMDVEYWLKEMHNITLQSLVERVMSKMSFIARALASSDATFQIQCLKTYYNFLKEETARNPYLKLGEFLQKIKLLQDNNLGLKLNKIVHGINGVNLMTAHGSKGLEFDYVFLLGCNSAKWEKDSVRLPFGLNGLLPGEPESANEEESRRLFYVALTRARKNIEVSYAIKDEKDKDLTKSVYVVELEESNTAPLLKEEVQEDEMLHFFDFMIQHNEEQFVDLVNQDFVSKELENFRMSATNLNNYLKCPVSFFYQNIVRVPSAKGASMTFGSAIHAALESLFKTEQEVFKNDESAKTVMHSQFSRYMLNNKESFTEEELQRQLYYGKELLSNYFDYYKDKWNENLDISVEVGIKNVTLNGVPIRGNVDKLEINGNTINVVDYKTGKYSNAKSKIKPPSSFTDNPEEADYEKRFGGDYWRQVMFYKALIENQTDTKHEVISGEIDFIEPESDKYHKVKIMINTEGYDFVINQIVDAYQKIMNKEFTKGCNDKECQWCNFNKYYLNKNEYTSEHLLNDYSDEMEER